MSTNKHIVTVVIPCFNEAEGIAKVVEGFHKGHIAMEIFNFDILVINNNSKDDTANIARKAGARVIDELKPGKGNAMRTGFANIHPNAEYVMMIDGDDTYKPKEALRLLEPLQSGFCDVVVGSRLGGKIRNGAMSSANRGGNWVFAHLVRIVYGLNLTDVFSGYFAWKRNVIEDLAPHLHSQGFAIEMEMITKMARMDCEVYSVPITLDLRSGTSTLRPFHDGLRVLKMFARNLTWHRREQNVPNLEDEA
jgi:glycosyltransferase involved in cell wall biosynthesis